MFKHFKKIDKTINIFNKTAKFNYSNLAFNSISNNSLNMLIKETQTKLQKIGNSRESGHITNDIVEGLKHIYKEVATLEKKHEIKLFQLAQELLSEHKYCETVEVCEEALDDTDANQKDDVILGLYKIYTDALLKLSVGGDEKTAQVIEKASQIFPDEPYFQEELEKVKILHQANQFINQL